MWGGSLALGGRISLIVEALKKLDSSKKLTEAHFNIYQEFIGE